MRRITIIGVMFFAPQALMAQNGVTHAVNSITADDIIRRIGVIAHDSMAGRDTPSPQLDQTAEYLAGEFRRMGLSPGAGDGSFIQRYPLRRERIDIVASRVSIEGGAVLRFGEDVAHSSGGPTVSGGVSGPVVVISGKPSGARSIERLEIEGAVVILVSTGWSRRNLFGLRRLGPAALLTESPRSDPDWRNMTRRARDRAPVRKGWGGRRGGPGSIPRLEVRPEAVAKLLDGTDVDLAEARRRGGRSVQARRIAGLTVNVNVAYETVAELSAPNVVAILEGSDPVLRDEYVTFSAHMDHDGVGAPVNGDSIWNGADDNASGTIAVVETAEAFASLNPRPRRSLMFIVVSGEEKGLWGSEYFAENPSVSIDRLVANLNADMVGRNWKDTIVAIGKEHSDLGETLNRVNARHADIGMTAIDDIWPSQGFYSRSDHYNFARKGVPILFFFNGTHEDYHKPSDEVEKIDGEKTARIVKLLFYLGLDIANADQRPRWYPESYRQIVGGN